jgi:hypothetical protein
MSQAGDQALATVAGGLVGARLYGTRKRSRQNGRLIRAAYESAQRKLGLRQGDVRQDTTESLNARGILNGGSGGIAPPGRSVRR